MRRGAALLAGLAIALALAGCSSETREVSENSSAPTPSTSVEGPRINTGVTAPPDEETVDEPPAEESYFADLDVGWVGSELPPTADLLTYAATACERMLTGTRIEDVAVLGADPSPNDHLIATAAASHICHR